MASPLRYLVLFFNFLFFVFGLILLGIGIWGELQMGDYLELTALENHGVNTGPRLMIAVGAIITFVSFFGCCGAWKENRCMLVIFLVLLLILLILEITVAAVAFKNKDKLKKEFDKELQSMIEKYEPGDKDIDDIQKKLKCCGVTGYKDWSSNTNYNDTSVPDSCCKNMTKSCGNKAAKADKPSDIIYTEGCYDIVLKDNEKILNAVGGVAIGLLVIQILGIIFSLVLIIRLGKKSENLK